MRIFLIIVFGLIVLFLAIVIELQILERADFSEEPVAVQTIDGCTTYKYYIKGERHYYTKCQTEDGVDSDDNENKS